MLWRRSRVCVALVAALAGCLDDPLLDPRLEAFLPVGSYALLPTGGERDGWRFAHEPCDRSCPSALLPLPEVLPIGSPALDARLGPDGYRIYSVRAGPDLADWLSARLELTAMDGRLVLRGHETHRLEDPAAFFLSFAPQLVAAEPSQYEQWAETFQNGTLRRNADGSSSFYHECILPPDARLRIDEHVASHGGWERFLRDRGVLGPALLGFGQRTVEHVEEGRRLKVAANEFATFETLPEGSTATDKVMRRDAQALLEWLGVQDPESVPWGAWSRGPA